jgi:uncharacterized protein YdhG (YjbR/CyaY superfamily)
MDKNQNIKFSSVDEYISSQSQEKRKIIGKIRIAVRQVVPLAEEVISYNMPAFKFHGILLYYAAHKEHIGFYPGNSKLIIEFKDELEGFETSKGTIKFPINKPLPINLIKKIFEIRADENLNRLKTGKTKKN